MQSRVGKPSIRLNQRGERDLDGEAEQLLALDWYDKCKHLHSLLQRGRQSGMDFPRNVPKMRRWSKRNLPQSLTLGDVTEEEVQALVIDNGGDVMKAGDFLPLSLALLLTFSLPQVLLEMILHVQYFLHLLADPAIVMVSWLEWDKKMPMLGMRPKQNEAFSPSSIRYMYCSVPPLGASSDFVSIID